MGIQDQAAPVRIHHRVPLAALHLLAGVVAPRSAALGRLDALAIDHCRSRAGLAPAPLAVEHDQVMVHGLPYPAVAQPGEPGIHRPPRREAVRQQPPGAARPQHSAAAGGPAQQGFRDAPPGIGRVARVAKARAAMLRAGGRGPRPKVDRRAHRLRIQVGPGTEGRPEVTTRWNHNPP